MKKFFYLAAIAAAVTFTACNSGGNKNNSEAGQTENVTTAEHNHDDQHALLAVGGSCEMCKDRIEKTVNNIEGVSSASYDLEDQELHLHFDPHTTNIDAISKTLADAGHDTDLYKAEQEVYDALPACCHYRK